MSATTLTPTTIVNDTRYIDLSGPEGNAYSLIAIAGQINKMLGYSKGYCKDFEKAMTSGDYENLLDVFERQFCKDKDGTAGNGIAWVEFDPPREEI